MSREERISLIHATVSAMYKAIGELQNEYYRLKGCAYDASGGHYTRKMAPKRAGRKRK